MKTLQEVVDRFGRLDVVINKAGYGLMGAIEEISKEEARQQMVTHFFGTLAVTQAAIPHLRKQGGANMIRFSSVAGMIGPPGVGPSAMPLTTPTNKKIKNRLKYT